MDPFGYFAYPSYREDTRDQLREVQATVRDRYVHSVPIDELEDILREIRFRDPVGDGSTVRRFMPATVKRRRPRKQIRPQRVTPTVDLTAMEDAPL